MSAVEYVFYINKIKYEISVIYQGLKCTLFLVSRLDSTHFRAKCLPLLMSGGVQQLLISEALFMLWSLILWNFFSECNESLIISGMFILTQIMTEKKYLKIEFTLKCSDATSDQLLISNMRSCNASKWKTLQCALREKKWFLKYSLGN